MLYLRHDLICMRGCDCKLEKQWRWVIAESRDVPGGGGCRRGALGAKRRELGLLLRKGTRSCLFGTLTTLQRQGASVSSMSLGVARQPSSSTGDPALMRARGAKQLLRILLQRASAGLRPGEHAAGAAVVAPAAAAAVLSAAAPAPTRRGALLVARYHRHHHNPWNLKVGPGSRLVFVGLGQWSPGGTPCFKGVHAAPALPAACPRWSARRGRSCRG